MDPPPCAYRKSRLRKALRLSKAEEHNEFPPVRYSQDRPLVSDDLIRGPALQGVFH